MTARSSSLSLRDVHTYYGSVHALKGITLDVFEGEMVALIGANGAGKSTTLMTICGLPAPRQGEIAFNGQAITNMPTDRRVRLGIAHVPEGRRIFPRMTVEENLVLGAFLRKDKKGIAQDVIQSYGLFPVLEERSRQLAGTLSGGEQQMLAIARALMSRPRLLLLDEPSMGLAPMVVKQLFAVITEVNRSGTTILLVEQNARMALRVAHRAYLLETGQITHTGSAKDFSTNDTIRAAYLGG